jgi:RNA polymerase sigma factor (sigma-70 family)
MMDKTDSELIEAFTNGDESSFNELVKRYQVRVYWIARRSIGNHADADDIVQEVFIRMYRGLVNFRQESNLYTWLYRVTVNVSLNAIRKKKMKEFLPFDDILENILPDGSHTDSKVLDSEYHTILESAIDRLPAKQKFVFNMRFHDELPFTEIAKILKKSVGGTKANYFHAIKKVTEYVKREINR